MYSFIFGFQRLVWCPKWTPASSSSFMVTAGATLASTLVAKKRLLDCASPGRRPGFPASRQAGGSRLPSLPLAELEATARALLAVLLPLLDPGVPREEPRLLQPLAQLQVDHAQGAGDAVAQRARLGRDAAAVQLRLHVVLVVRLGHREGLLDEHLERLVAAEELVERVVVQRERPGARKQADPRDGRLPLPGCVVLGRCGAQRSSLTS